MIRKAQSLKSLEELKLPNELCEYLEFKFSIPEEGSLEEMVWYARVVFYQGIDHLVGITFHEDTILKLVDALDKLGFIRHDITASSFCINQLYREVYPDVDPKILPLFNELGNDGYENFKNPLPDFITEVKRAVMLNVTAKEYNILALRFGLEDGKYYSRAEVGVRQHMTHQYVGQLEEQAIKKLMDANLPDLEYCTKGYAEKVQEIIDEITKLRSELIELSKLPLVCASKARQYLRDELAYDALDVDHLGLSHRACNLLKRSGMYTVTDVLRYPKNKWLEINNFGCKAADEIVEKMRAAGYDEFYINLY